MTLALFSGYQEHPPSHLKEPLFYGAMIKQNNYCLNICTPHDLCVTSKEWIMLVTLDEEMSQLPRQEGPGSYEMSSTVQKYHANGCLKFFVSTIFQLIIFNHNGPWMKRSR